MEWKQEKAPCSCARKCFVEEDQKCVSVSK
jgi:hypothetical protein